MATARRVPLGIGAQRRLLSDDPALADFVRMATLAAKGHNTRPSLVRLNDNLLSILPDMSRRTQVVDPDDHHLYVSLGCAAENLVIAAGAHGRPSDVTIANGPESHIDVRLGTGTATDETLYRAIPYRQSTRSAYDGRPLSSNDFAALEHAAQQDGVSVPFITDPQDREVISDFVIEGNSAQMDDPAFLAALRDWLRFSPDHAIRQGDGLFSACSGSPIVPRLETKRS